jgi:hypothetical protein
MESEAFVGFHKESRAIDSVELLWVGVFHYGGITLNERLGNLHVEKLASHLLKLMSYGNTVANCQ